MDFKAAAAAEASSSAKVVQPIKAVQLAGQVVLKIVQHCDEALPQLVTGQLLGLDVGQTLEVTDCFAFPAPAGEPDDEDAGASYQLDMMRCLREVNADNNTVGWYQSASMGNFQTEDLIDLIETFVNYHENIKKCVCLVYDPQRSKRGSLALRAIRLKDTFIELYKQGRRSAKDLVSAGLSHRDVFQEIPIKIHNSSLTQALITELEPDNAATASDFDRLNLSFQPFMEKSIASLNDNVEELADQQFKVTQYHKAVARQAQQMAQWLQKRRADNMARRAAGEELLPEEDPVLFKPVVEPNLLANYLTNNQITTSCEQLNLAATQTLQKLYVMEALQKPA